MKPLAASSPAEAQWRQRYAELSARIPELAAAARPLITGFAACVDKLVDLHQAAPGLSALADPNGRGFFREVMTRAAEGRGGEILADWPDGPAFLDRFAIAGRTAAGGTSAQAANSLALIGAPVILALEDRSAEQLDVLHPAIALAAGDGGLTTAGVAKPEGRGKPAHYIVEYTAGRALPGFTPRRSTRIIVRFADEDIERDPGLAAFARLRTHGLGAGLLSSPNAVSPEYLPAALRDIAAAVGAWRKAGAPLVHLELGEYPWPGTRDQTISALAPVITSLGLNHNELKDLVSADAPPAEAAIALAQRRGLSRVTVHADHWALCAARGDPEREMNSLLAGCLLASARAAAGRPVAAPAVPAAAKFSEPPLPPVSRHGGGWFIACCPSPFLAQPASTVGLGDTFAAGTMLVHAAPSPHPSS